MHRFKPFAAWSARAAPLLQSLLLAALLFAVAALNGRPAFFGDTPFYYSQGEYLATALGYPQAPMTAAGRADPDSVAPGSAGVTVGYALFIAKARSPLYGLFLFLWERLGGLWMLVWAQCLCAAWVIVLVARVMVAKKDASAFLVAAAVLVLGTSLPFFTAFAMPDVFAGLNLISIVLLVVYPDRLSKLERMGVWALLAFGLAAHTTNVLVLVGLTGGVAAVLAARRRPLRQIAELCGPLLATALVALGATAAAAALYQHKTGLQQNSPPFLMATVLGGGAGRAYLAAHCPKGASPTLCRLADHPLNDAEAFLWSWTPHVGVFMLQPTSVDAQLKREEPAFVLHALAEHPLMAIRAAALNGMTQLSLFETVEPLHNPAEFLIYPWWRKTSIWRILPGHAECERQPRRCQPRFSLGALRGVQVIVLTVSVMGLVMAAASSDLRRAFAISAPRRRREIARAAQAAWLTVAAAVLNAGVCGALSSPFPRYEARLIWVIPLISVLLIWTLPWRAALGGFRSKQHPPSI